MTYVIAITGGIGSGKTTVADKFHSLYNIDIVDADVVARKVVLPNTKALKAIEKHFGSSILLNNGELDRAELRHRIFSNPNDKVWLNELLHPIIREEMTSELHLTQSDYALLVVPLLVENQLQSLAHQILVVDVSEETQITRTVERDNVAKEQVKNILASQASRNDRLAIADDVIHNDDNSSDLDDKIALLHQKYLILSQTYKIRE